MKIYKDRIKKLKNEKQSIFSRLKEIDNEIFELELKVNPGCRHNIKNYIEVGIDKDYLEKLTDDLVRRKINPNSAALEIINRSIKQVKLYDK